jgi:hypothetical protein
MGINFKLGNQIDVLMLDGSPMPPRQHIAAVPIVNRQLPDLVYQTLVLPA